MEGSTGMAPNYAFERSVMEVATSSGNSADDLLSGELRVWCPAQRER